MTLSAPTWSLAHKPDVIAAATAVLLLLTLVAGTAGPLPPGIPPPVLGFDLDVDRAATIYVDNTHPACDNNAGTAAAPLCDLFRGADSVTFHAGDVVHVLGGPYAIAGNLTLTLNGTAEAPVIISGQGATRILFDGAGQRVNLSWHGSFAAIENLDFYHKTRQVVDAHHMALRNVGVRNPPEALIDFNPVVNLRGHDLLVEACEIGNNRRATNKDSHGLHAGAGSYNLWILNNHVYNNNGDAFQGCHGCFEAPPHHVYIGGNTMHEDRENAVDLKTIHDVIVSGNTLYGYQASATSSGDAIVVGSNGFDEATNMGPRRVWILHNDIRQSTRGIRLEGSQDVWIVGNRIRDAGGGLQIDHKPHRRIIIAANTMQRVGRGITAWGCSPAELTIFDNIIDVLSGPHIDLPDCGADVLQLRDNRLSGDAVTDVGLDARERTRLESVYAEFQLAWGRELVTATEDRTPAAP